MNCSNEELILILNQAEDFNEFHEKVLSITGVTYQYDHVLITFMIAKLSIPNGPKIESKFIAIPSGKFNKLYREIQLNKIL